jgi:hypothetical protein
VRSPYQSTIAYDSLSDRLLTLMQFSEFYDCGVYLGYKKIVFLRYATNSS